MNDRLTHFHVILLIATSWIAFPCFSTDAQTYTVIKTFAPTPDGAKPQARFTFNGSILYGTTMGGGTSGVGTIFKVNMDGTGYTVLKNFNANDGMQPYAGVILEGNTLFGTTESGGGLGAFGVLYKIKTDGTGFEKIKTFLWDATSITNADGYAPRCDLVFHEGMLYGTASSGGNAGAGTVFKVSTNGADFSVIKHLNGTSEGQFPKTGLVLGGNTLYGTASTGGSGGVYGTVFKLNIDGSGFAVLKDFSPGARQPLGRLVLNGSTLYGTTEGGGSSGLYGTIFKINTNGTDFFTLWNFSDTPDGARPGSGVTLDADTLYGTTRDGGSSNTSRDGTVFRINTDGTGYEILWNFGHSFNDGWDPQADLILSGNILYGSNVRGGVNDRGTLFKLDLANIAPIPIHVQSSGTNIILFWSNTAFNLQFASTLTNVFTNVNVTSPYTNQFTNLSGFFRLRAN